MIQLHEPTGIAGPHNLQVAPDGKNVWVVSGHASLALMIDASTFTVHGALPTSEEPALIIVTPDSKTAYATNGGDNTVTAIAVDTMKVITTIPVGEYPHGLRPSPDGKWVYAANGRSTTLSIILHGTAYLSGAAAVSSTHLKSLNAAASATTCLL